MWIHKSYGTIERSMNTKVCVTSKWHSNNLSYTSALLYMFVGLLTWDYEVADDKRDERTHLTPISFKIKVLSIYTKRNCIESQSNIKYY